MNPDFLPALGRSLRALAEFATWREVNDTTLAEIAAEIDRARALVAQARGVRRANTCPAHPGGPVDPTAENGCLLCGTTARRPARPVPDNFVPGDVLRFIAAHGQEEATARYGAQAVTRALVVGNRHPSTRRPGQPAAPGTPSGNED